jgi:hypothetical protein
MSSTNASMRSNNGDKSLFKYIMIGLAIILVLFLFYTLYSSYSNYNQTSPYLINGITDGTIPQQFSSYQIMPPSDSQYGTEMTYSFWIFIKDTNFSNQSAQCSGSDLTGGFLHVFHKGSYDYVPSGTNGGSNSGASLPLLQSPGVWLYPNVNKLNIRFNTYENIVETADVGNIPLNMWVNVIIILIGNSVDVYINGNLKKRVKLSGVPKLNYGNLYTSNWGGFQGYLDNLRYFNYAIQPYLVDQIFNMGPSKTFASNINQGIMDPSATLAPNYWMTVGYPNINSTPGYNQNSGTST